MQLDSRCGQKVFVMEWREQSTVSCDEAYSEAQRWIEAVTKKKFGRTDFRSELENGMLLCDLINKIKPGTIKRVNRLPTPIAGLDNLNVFLRACGKLGLKEAQLFHPGDLQDLSTRVTVKAQETNRRLKNVLITLYWLGRRAQCDPVYDGPYLNFKAFEGLLGTALYKALQESSSQKDNSVLRDSGFGDSWYPEQEDHLRVGGGGHRREDSLDSLDSVGSRSQSLSSDITLKGSSEGFYSDTEADSVFRMGDKDSLSYRRSLVVTPKTTTQFNQFLPTKDKASGYVPAPLRKKRAERNEDSRRSWADPCTEDDTPLTRQPQRQDSIEGSKSTSDILMDPSVIRQVRYEELQKFREHIKESEDKWQDDLSKWKSRRKSVNSDIVKKKEEREKIEEITYGGNKRSKTFKEMQAEKEKRRESIGSRLKSLSNLDDEDVFDKPVAAPRSLPTRSYTIDTAYYSSSTFPETSLKEDEPPAASPATGLASFPTASQEAVDSSAGSDTMATITPSSYRSHHCSPSPPAAPQRRSLVPEHTGTVETVKTTTTASLLNPQQRALEPTSPLLGTHTKAQAPYSHSEYKQPQHQSLMEAKPPAVSRVSASLPRSYQRSDSARLTSVVTPRPFGTQSSRISSLSRALTTDDSHKPVNGDLDTSKKASVPSRYHPFMTSEDEAQSSSEHSSEAEDDQQRSPEKSVPPPQSKSPAPVEIKSESTVSPAPVKDTRQESYCEMRISLNQKPNSSRDFGFQAAWDSTGARVTSIVPGSPAEMCQLQAGDEVLSVNGHQVADMSYTAWKSHLDEALQEGSLVLDIRRHGKKTWDRDQPSLPFKTHKTINLTSMDHPILLGTPDTNIVNTGLDLTSHISTKPEAAEEPITRPDVASNRVNGGFREEQVTMRNKESEPISLKNLKRRSEFFEQGGTEPAMPDIPVPSITPSSSRWSWDPEEERRRQEKWQKEQERLLQEKYKRDQEKLQEEWLKAQQEINSSPNKQELTSLEVNKSEDVSLRSPLSPVSQPLTPLWEEQEKKQKEELERQRQAKERELQRLREERQKRERQEEEERRRREVEAAEQRRKEKEEEERRRREAEAAEQRRKEKERALEIQQQQWASGSPVQWQPPLSFADRARSKSSPQLDEVDRPQQKVADSVGSQKKGQQSATQAELERQQILNEMKKKTSLLTDGSWIRQRSSTTSSSGSTRDTEGSSMRRSVSGKKVCTYCDIPLGKGAAMIIESLGLCYHLGCFKCFDCESDLGGSEAGAEVRIRNKHLYCNACYMRFKTAQPTSM